MEDKQLKNFVRGKISQMMEQILDYVEITAPTPDGYKVIRAKILRVGNRCMRSVDKRFEIVIDVAMTDDKLKKLLDNLDREE